MIRCGYYLGFIHCLLHNGWEKLFSAKGLFSSWRGVLKWSLVTNDWNCYPNLSCTNIKTFKGRVLAAYKEYNRRKFIVLLYVFRSHMCACAKQILFCIVRWFFFFKWLRMSSQIQDITFFVVICHFILTSYLLCFLNQLPAWKRGRLPPDIVIKKKVWWGRELVTVGHFILLRASGYKILVRQW